MTGLYQDLIKTWISRFRRRTVLDPQGRSVIGPWSIYILPTKNGLVMAVLLILMLVGSINYGSNLGYLVTFFLGGLWLVTVLTTWRNLLGLTFKPIEAPPVFASQPAYFRILLSNPGSLPRFGLQVDIKQGQGMMLDINSEESNPVILSLPSTRRGPLMLSNVSIHSTYPLGLFRAWTYLSMDLSCLVYPKPAEHGEPPTEPTYNPSDAGDRGVGADDFVGLRNFRHGDSPRHVDWKALARERGLMSKQFGGDRAHRISLDWDLLTESDPEQRLSLLTRFILRAEEEQLTYGLRLPGIDIEPGRQHMHMHSCLTALANFDLRT